MRFSIISFSIFSTLFSLNSFAEEDAEFVIDESIFNENTNVDSNNAPAATETFAVPDTQNRSKLIGGYTGLWNMADFEATLLLGAEAQYQWSEKWSTAANFAVTEVDDSSAERILGQSIIVEPETQILSLLARYHLAPAQLYISPERTLYASFDLNIGPHMIRFNEEDFTGVVAGITASIWVAPELVLQVRALDYLVFDSTWLERDGMSQSIELSAGVSLRF